MVLTTVSTNQASVKRGNKKHVHCHDVIGHVGHEQHARFVFLGHLFIKVRFIYISLKQFRQQNNIIRNTKQPAKQERVQVEGVGTTLQIFDVKPKIAISLIIRRFIQRPVLERYTEMERRHQRQTTALLHQTLCCCAD